MKIPVIQTTTSQPEVHEHLEYSDCRPFPASHMSEYFVPGLVADKLDRAAHILKVHSMIYAARLLHYAG
jgi:hypothetical protein